MLILAFNKMAAQEIGDRVRGAAGIPDYCNARTFHSLAWQLADHAGRTLIFDDGNLEPSRHKQTGLVERTIASVLNPTFHELLYTFFRQELEQLDRLGSHLSEEEYAVFRRAMTNYTLGGETVRSNGEKFIADFLFEHDIHYVYERVYSWDRQDRLNGVAYRPDFSILADGRDVILEHWAIDPEDPSAEVPSWWETNTRKYRMQIEAKRCYWVERGILLLETHAGMLVRGREAFEAKLHSILENAGVRCRKLDRAPLAQRVAEAPRSISRMSDLLMQFISRAKKRGWSVADTVAAVAEHSDPEPRCRAFHAMAVRVYEAYEQSLREQQAMDFDDLLISAAETVRREGGSARLRLGDGGSIALRDLRWILIDEFQDFSELYQRLITAILSANPSIRVVAVGDDWQAINAFAGAQLSYFHQFREYFPGAGIATISTNRRSARAIVDGGNQLMSGLGAPARGFHDFAGSVQMVAIDKVWLDDGSIYLEAAMIVRGDGSKAVSWDLARALSACTEAIANAVQERAGTENRRTMPNVLLLARTARVYGVALSEFARRLDQALRQHAALQSLGNDYLVGRPSSRMDADAARIEVLTAHRAKGKEADTVIVLEAMQGRFPLVHADNQLFGPFGVSADDVLAEERRLFYVAVTRAERKLVLVADTSRPSPYQDALVQSMAVSPAQPKRAEPKLGGLAQSVLNRLQAGDRAALIRSNVSTEAAATWDRLQTDQLGLPTVGYTLREGLHAELAWPDARPPVAIITGRHKAKAGTWRALGWCVHADQRKH